ncbi:MAG: hypothetical protein GY719_06565 [bacterium]|nr:hypothetical protein [bacterium]
MSRRPEKSPLDPPFSKGGKSNRKLIGGDVYLTKGTGSAPRLDLGFNVPDWKARQEGAFHRATFPGTAVLVGERWYEIVSVATSAGAPRRTYYDLREWDDTAVIRTAFELTPEACQALTQAHREREKRRKQAAAVALMPVFTGLLPAPDQKRLENAYGVSPVSATMISALVLLIASTIVIMLTFAYSQGMAFGEDRELIKRIVAWAPLAAYLLVESIVRIYAVKGNQPAGSLLLVLPIIIWRGLREAATPPDRQDTQVRVDTLGLRTARDRVRRLEGGPNDLEVISRMPKDHWTANVTGIEYQGEAYLLIERGVIDTDAGRRHRFLLAKPKHNVLFKSYVLYDPEEVREIYRQQRLTKSAMWAETFAFLWGLTDGATQERLAKLYKYDPDRWTTWTTIAGGVGGLALCGRGIYMMAGDYVHFVDGIAFFLGLFLTWEAAIRWSRLKDGQLTGSLAGLLLKPLAVRFLRWE